MSEAESKAIVRKRGWTVFWMVLTGLGFALSVWGAWDAYESGERLKLFRRVVGAGLFLFWFTQRYERYRSLRREG
ncbi:MAG: hypothetical protein EBZ67_09060 [Chitinophagia bacterium]|nr:hypothetical protein [Chitinophagia bacterium]